MSLVFQFCQTTSRQEDVCTTFLLSLHFGETSKVGSLFLGHIVDVIQIGIETGVKTEPPQNESQDEKDTSQMKRFADL